MDRELQLEFRKEDIAKATRIVVIAFVVLFVIVVCSKTYYTVQPNEQAVVLRFGRYSSTAQPGLHFRIPFVDTVLTADMGEHTIRLPLGVEEKTTGIRRNDRRSAVEGESDLMLTGNLNPVVVQWTIQYRVSDPREFLFRFYYGDDLQLRGMGEDGQDVFLKEVVTRIGNSVMNQVIGDYSFDEVLTTKRSEIRTKAHEETQKLVDSFHCGIRVTDLQLQRVVPPKEVTKSFAAVNEAAQTRVKLRNEANKERNELMPQARADRDKAIREAEGDDVVARGIELVEVGITNIGYVKSVRESSFAQLNAGMDSVAATYEKEGEEEKQKVINETKAEVEKIIGEGEEQSKRIRGEVEAEIIKAYADALKKTGDFYTFLKTLEVYESAMTSDTQLILTTDSDLFRMLKGLDPEPKQDRQ